MLGKKVVSSTVISETQSAWNLQSTTVSAVIVTQVPCRLYWAAIWPGVQVIQ